MKVKELANGNYLCNMSHVVWADLGKLYQVILLQQKLKLAAKVAETTIKRKHAEGSTAGALRCYDNSGRVLQEETSYVSAHT